MANGTTFSEDRARELERFLSKAAGEGALTYRQTAGFLFAVASAPEPVTGPDWQEFVLGEAEFADEREGKAVKEALDALLDWTEQRGAAGESPLPPGCEAREEPVENIGHDAPLGQWSRGFTFGHQWLEDDWEGRVPDDLDSEYQAAVLILSFFSSRRVAEACLERAEAADTVAELAGHMLELMPQARSIYFELGRAIRQALSEEDGGGRPSGADGGYQH